jgi:hypothetical protein
VNGRRVTVFEFRLARRARVRFEVVQLAPLCRRVGAFVRRAHRGVNRIRFDGRLGRRRLAPGTYAIAARVLGRPGVFRLAVHVAKNRAVMPRSPDAAQAASVCTALPDAPAGARVLASVLSYLAARAVAPAATGDEAVASPSEASSKGSGERAVTLPAQQGEALGAEFTQTTGVDGLLRVFVLVGALIAMLLLAVATLPVTVFADPRLMQLVARRRVEFALLGGSTLLAVVLVYLARA